MSEFDKDLKEMAQSLYEYAIERRYDIKREIETLEKEKEKMDNLIETANENRKVKK